MTLIELMIVIVVVAILASIAVPSYRQFVMRSHRVEGKTALLNLAAAQEKFYLQNNRYATDDERADAPPAGLGFPDTTENGWYTLEITVDDADDPQEWSLTATAAGAQVADSDCAEFSLTSAGVKSATSSKCWE
jgi:type IV pilus assembly protein PilE